MKRIYVRILFLYFMIVISLMKTINVLAGEFESEKVNLSQAGATDVLGHSEYQPFLAGTGGSEYFRIPALLQLSNGWIIATADARWEKTIDAGGLDTIASISKDNGDTWEYSFPVFFPDSKGFQLNTTTTIIDPALLQGNDGTIYLFVNVNPTETASYYGPLGQGTGFISVEGKWRLALTSSLDNVDIAPSDEDISIYEYYVGDYQEGYAPVMDRKTNALTEYVLDDWYNLYKRSSNDEYIPMTQKQVDDENVDIQQNVFYHDSILHVFDTNYMWLSVSNDNGLTWRHKILNFQLRKENEDAIVYSPGKGVVSRNGAIILGFYKPEGSNVSKAGFIYSKDNGETWSRTSFVPDTISYISESEIVELPDGTLRMFIRTGNTNVVTYCDAVYNDKQEIYEWRTPVLTDVKCTSSCNCTAILYSKPINGKPAIMVSYPGGDKGSSSSGRNVGKIFTFLLNNDNTMELFSTFQVNDSFYGYSSMDELSDGTIGLLWENSGGSIRFDKYEIKSIIPDGEIGKDIEITIPLYQKTSMCVLGATKQDDLSGFDGDIAEVTKVTGEIFTFKGVKCGDTSFVANDVKYIMHVTEPLSKDMTEITINVGEKYELGVSTPGYEQYGDSASVNAGSKIVVTGETAGITDIVIDDHIYRFSVIDQEYTVSLDTNGGIANVSSFKITYGKEYGELPVPVLDGYTFDGWYDENGQKITLATRHFILGDVILTASWIPKEAEISPAEESESTPALEESESIPTPEETESAPASEETESAPAPEETESASVSEESESMLAPGETESASALKETESTSASVETEGMSVPEETESTSISEKPTGVTLNKKAATVNKGKTITLKATVKPKGTVNRKVKWSTSNKKVATVTQNGVVKGVKAGTAVITVKTENGKKAVCKVTVKVPAAKVTLNKKTLYMVKGKKLTIRSVLKAAVSPSDSTDKVIWSSAKSSVVTIKSGKLVAKKVGTAKITAKAGRRKATITIKVVNKAVKATAVKLNKKKLTLRKGKTVVLKATIKPVKTTEIESWSSSDKKVASVDRFGKITAKKKGKATITVKIGKRKAVCKLTVK